MSVFRERPKGAYIKEANLEELYVLTSHWKQDLEFYKNDLLFQKRLIDKYFIWITRDDNLEAVENIVKNIRASQAVCKDLLKQVKLHLSAIGKLLEDKDSADTKAFRIEHESLEDKIAAFIKSFRKNKKEVFKITEMVIDSEQLANVVNKTQ
ncbi:hypothetical protein [Salegentibacter chungangensis]|uniref:Uncharacterized protein n=1 Tax=Salegentibacter chungangensis TaxID=1335724 RepID=A0ABW3NQ40_9FLAO